MYKVLIVDDEEITRIQLKRMINLNELEFSITGEASNGWEAMTKVEQSQFDLIITDIKMPKVDGIELLKHLNSKGVASCVVFLSGYSDFKYAQQGLVLGAFDYILKPVEPGKVLEVLKRVKEFLARKKTEEVDKQKLLDKLNDAVNVFYPYNREKTLVALIEAGDPKALQIAEELVEEVFLVFNGSCYNSGLLLNTVLINISRELALKYQLFDKLFNMKRFTGNEVSENVKKEELKTGFNAAMGDLLSIIKQYDLNQKDSIISKVCEYVLKHVDEDISLKVVAEAFYMNKNYLCSLFKQKTGEYFLDYLTKVKMERAKILLKNDNVKAYEVSSRLGYSETAYFSKLFKKYTGFSPTEYRKKRD